jgi:hypothetical protein
MYYSHGSWHGAYNKILLNSTHNQAKTQITSTIWLPVNVVNLGLGELSRGGVLLRPSLRTGGLSLGLWDKVKYSINMETVARRLRLYSKPGK